MYIYILTRRRVMYPRAEFRRCSRIFEWLLAGFAAGATTELTHGGRWAGGGGFRAAKNVYITKEEGKVSLRFFCPKTNLITAQWTRHG